MRQSKLGSSDLWVSEIGLGCMSIGSDEKQGISIIHEALDLGVNFLDTADLYDDGQNEAIVGKAILGRRDHIILSTKVGNRRIPGQEALAWDPSKKHILASVKDSLRRLQTDYIDLYQLHGGMMNDPMDETIEAFEQLKQEGLIRYYGISSIRPNVIREYVTRANIVSVMSQYSILDRRPEEEILPLLAENDISMIVRGPVARGILSPRGDQKIVKGYLDHHTDDLRILHEQLQSLVTEERSLAQIALRYVLSDPAVAVTIPGASSIEQLRHNIMASDISPLTEDEITLIRKVSKANLYTDHR
ncbi:aldo/keto reductase [Paenibacillus crassostreae]|uniref:Oxidoreductase n=1 Tax=Paenibacillus crassostreae TaxID=1763538 RepID=A0A167DWA7_9BACL|nr:aldo/keto reductase [Paenibacillus crassostreae]AOZ90983.1 oxidoreductase [Paenibacillus crassostreae]OAB74854.1 oxidoreductase [Paenibacillus crassostreae]